MLPFVILMIFLDASLGFDSSKPQRLCSIDRVLCENDMRSMQLRQRSSFHMCGGEI